MSIYATLWILKLPKKGDYVTECDWIKVMAQGVPAAEILRRDESRQVVRHKADRNR